MEVLASQPSWSDPDLDESEQVETEHGDSSWAGGAVDIYDPFGLSELAQTLSQPTIDPLALWNAPLSSDLTHANLGKHDSIAFQQLGQATPLSSDGSGSSQCHAVSHTGATPVAPETKPIPRRNETTDKRTKGRPIQSGDDDDDFARGNLRERNRRAAAKCRAKKKVNMGNLEERWKEEKTRNNNLKHELLLLRHSLTDLRTEALQHDENCGCDGVHHYNMMKALEVTRNF